ncbi:MAG TPA: hydrogenase formation protein HypD [Acidimicrobiales bacterium]|nr:hydrogenase formation protein HypD [Acidimicrobiales bacterium]
MRFVDEFRDSAKARALAGAIAATCPPQSHYKLMEVCGGHTHTIYRHGIERYLPANVELIHGPGCPVCVIPMGRVDDAVWLSKQEDVTLTCFGDLMRVPGRNGSLLDASAAGADVRVVYSPLDALRIAEREPGRRVVFFAIGFETTTPSSAVTILQAHQRGVRNFSVFCNHVTIIPPLRAVLDAPDVGIDGFIGPGHVSAVTGCEVYLPLAHEYHRPVVVSGFEPLDVLQSVLMLVRQLASGRCEVENQYSRAVTWTANARARAVVEEVFELRPVFEWRGLGEVPWSALRPRAKYAAHDAEAAFAVPGTRSRDPRACQCGEVLRGKLKPYQCRVFAKACTPEHPIGTCMVSAEGACAAYYNFSADRKAATSWQTA